MFLGDIIDKFHYKNGFADACAAKKTDFTALGIGADKIDYLNSRFKYLGRGRKILIGRGGTMDIPALCGFGGGNIINGIAENVKDSSEGFATYGHAYRGARIGSVGSALESVGRCHGDTSCGVIADMLCDLDGQGALPYRYLKGIENLGQFAFAEADVDNRSHNLNNLSDS